MAANVCRIEKHIRLGVCGKGSHVSACNLAEKGTTQTQMLHCISAEWMQKDQILGRLPRAWANFEIVGVAVGCF